MTMTGQDTAQIALNHARRSRRVLIVTRRAVQASDAIEAVSEALTADDDAIVRRTAGAWNVTLPNGGRIDVRPYSSHYALRGMSADTVLLDASVRSLSIEAEVTLCLMTSPAPELLLQRDL